jgi:hypothetical protein
VLKALDGLGPGDAVGGEEMAAEMDYEVDRLGIIEQALKALQGHGIMALELIQNADDAKASRLVFDARDDALVIENNATFTKCSLARSTCDWEASGGPDGRRQCNFHAIRRMGSRSKIHAQDQIGRFGIGFVSVYQITDTPIVRSVGVQIRINPKSGKVSNVHVPHAENTVFELPWAFEQSDVRSGLNGSPVPTDVADQVVAAVTAILPSSLLFLRHLARVEVRRAGTLVASVDIRREDGHVDLLFQPGNRIRRWAVLSRSAEDVIEGKALLKNYPALVGLDRSTTVDVAIPADDGEAEGRLYAYLPTKQPTGLPLHVNADFFPHASRQDIVLDGTGHERQWNEALIATAATIVGENFAWLKGRLGPRRLWALGAAALERAKDGPFGEFWTRFASAARTSASVPTSDDGWAFPVEVRSPPREMDEREQAAIVSVGLKLMHPSLRPYFNALHDAQVGVRVLRLPDLTARVVALPDGYVSDGNIQLRPLWSAVATMIEAAARGVQPPEVLIAPLRKARFLLARDGSPRSPDELRRLPDNMPPDVPCRALPGLPVAPAELLGIARLAALVRTLGLDDFASALATEVSDLSAAAALVGDDERLRAAYRALVLLWTEGQATSAGTVLDDAPILRNSDGSLVEPRRAQLPSHFQDPTGWFQLVDTSMFPPGMERFAGAVLGVDTLTFPTYIERHLADAIGRGMERQQYRDILAQMGEHRHELGAQGATLKDCAFVRNRAGAFVRPRDCMFLTAELQILLGEEPERWVDLAWLPADGMAASRVRDLLTADLDMPTSVSADLIVRRVTEIADDMEPTEAARALAPVMRHVVDRWTTFDEDAKDELEGLSSVMFMPGMLKGELDTDRLYYTEEVFRAARAPGFDSQVPIVALQPLRASDRDVNAFLDLIGVDFAPATGVIVDHLLDCIAANRAPSDVTYALLSERFTANDGIADVERLRGEPFIHDAGSGFVHADVVFWNKPPWGGRWRQVGGKMRERHALFAHLGVAISPEPRHYASLALDIASDPDRDDTDVTLHARCLAQLAADLEDGVEGAAEALDGMAADECLIALDGSALWPGDALWMDSDAHLSPFGRELDHLVVAPPPCDAAAVRAVFARLGAGPLSESVRIDLAEAPHSEVDEAATATLRERSELLVRLAPSRQSRAALRQMLHGVEVRRADRLMTVAELLGFAEPITSSPTSADIHIDPQAPAIHLTGNRVGLAEWGVVTQHLLGSIAHLCPQADVRALAAAAHFALSLPTLEAAEEALASHGFQEHAQHDLDLPDAEELMDVGPDGSEGQHHAGDEGGPAGRDDESHAYARQDDLSGDGGHAEDEDFGASGDPSEGNAAADDGNEAEGQDESVNGDGSAGSPPDSGGPASQGTQDAGHGGSDDPYRSNAVGGGIGVEEKSGAGKGGGGGRPGFGEAKERSGKPGSDRRSGDERKERSRSRSRMRSYVGRENEERRDDSSDGGAWDETNDLVDAAAVEAVLAYERANQREPEEQSHSNPGYDIVSRSSDGSKRLIEVKGINGDWDGLGVKLSAVQYRFAREHPEEFWLYVIEHALDDQRRHVRPLRNPFARVDEYWFDGEWRKACEVGASTRDLLLKVGARVEEARWGRGVIESIDDRGIMKQAKVRFDIFGLKIVPVAKLDLVG